MTQLSPYVMSDKGEVFSSWPRAKERALRTVNQTGGQLLELRGGGSIQSKDCQVLPTAGMAEGDLCRIADQWFEYRDRGWLTYDEIVVPAPPWIEALELPKNPLFSDAYALLYWQRPFQLTCRSARLFVEALRRTETDLQPGSIPDREDDNEYRVLFEGSSPGKGGVLRVWMKHSVGRFIGAEGKHVRAIQRRLQAQVRRIEAKSFEEQ